MKIPTDTPLPIPVYGCEVCYEDHAWPAEDLVWWDGRAWRRGLGDAVVLDSLVAPKPGWYCEGCVESISSAEPPASSFGPTLAEHLTEVHVERAARVIKERFGFIHDCRPFARDLLEIVTATGEPNPKRA